MSVDLETYRQIVENSADAILIMVDLKIMFANKAALEIYGAQSEDELIGKDALSIGLLTLPQHGRTQELEMRRIQGDFTKGLFEFPATLKDGREGTFEVSISNIPFNGKIGALCIIRDISERKESENRLHTLHESAALLSKATNQGDAVRIVLDSIKDIFGLHYSAIGFVEDGNLVFRHSTGKNRIEELPLIGPGLTVRAIREKKTQVVNNTADDPDYVDGRYEGDNKTLSELDIPVIVDDEAIAIITIEEDKLNSFDLEEVQLMEILANHFASALGRIIHNQQLTEMRETHVKELIGGLDKMCFRVQDELKGPIHTIRNSSFIIRHNPELAPEVIDNIDNSIELMMTTIEEMTEITSPTEPDKTLTDIYSVLQRAIDVSSIPRNVELVSDFEEGFLAINIDNEKIQRVFFNLIRNAVEAMPKGGRLTVDLEITTNYVVVSFTDTGEGIPDDLMEQIYLPFFSTKPKSLGLGLSFCKLAVESNGGAIDIQSKVGEGTKVVVKLPI